MPNHHMNILLNGKKRRMQKKIIEAQQSC